MILLFTDVVEDRATTLPEIVDTIQTDDHALESYLLNNADGTSVRQETVVSGAEVVSTERNIVPMEVIEDETGIFNIKIYFCYINI